MELGNGSVGIGEFYAGKNVFVTGATGFLGKTLMEKLLRSCPDIGKIYVLVRPKKGKKLHERLDAVWEDKLYDRLKEEQPGALEKKVIPLAGDVTELELGLSAEDKQTIIDEVNVVFHNAASVRFDDHLKQAIKINLVGTREMALLALKIKNLSLLVHVSTAFVNCHVLEVEEKMYPPPADWRKMIEIAENCDEMTLKALTLKVLNGMPNTYTFTKNLGEHCIYELCKGKIPLLIARPTIVVATLKEPVPGWIDNFNGPAGILIAYGKGIMRTLYCNDNKRPDYIPVDITIKAMIVASWDVALRRDIENPEIFHIASYKCDWIRPSHKRLAEQCLEVGLTIPFNNILWTIKGHTSGNKLNVYLRIILCQLLPAFILDEVIKLSGNKPMLKNITRRIYSAQVALRFFMNQEWSFFNDKMFANMDKIQYKDQKTWAYEFRDYDFHKYVADCLMGGRRYLLNETDDTLPQAKKHMHRIYLLDKILKYLFYASVFTFAVKLDVLTSISDTTHNLLTSFIQ